MMVLLLGLALSLSSVVAYSVCYNLVMSRFSNDTNNSPKRLFTNDGIIDMMDGDSVRQQMDLIRQEMTNRVASELHNTLLSYFVISTLITIFVGIFIAFFMIKKPLDHLNRGFSELKNFVYDVSHELKTPLAVIRGYSELYQMKANVDKDNNIESLIENQKNAQEALSKIGESAKRMDLLVNDLLTLAKLDQEKKVELTKVDVLPIINEIVGSLKVMDSQRNVQIINNASSTHVLANEQNIWRVFLNLVQNIHRYTDEDVGVEIVLKDISDKIRIDFIDHGKGMKKDDIKHIFDRFWTKSESRERKESGTGLGMAICKSVIESFGGSITAHPTDKGGLTVSIILKR